MNKNLLLFLSLSILLCACQNNTQQDSDSSTKQKVAEENPPAEGFNLEDSDQKAIELADQVMKAHGGRVAWDSTRLLVWNFFGFRKLYWDKQSGDVRIDFTNNDLKIILNEKSMEGRVFKDGQEFQQTDSLKKYLDQGKSIWINDSYWLVMPFKLKDSGVTLKYLREDTTQNGRKSQVLQLTFKNVGDTPQNKYEVFVDQENYMVTQWSYFKEATQDSANFTLPWLDYKKHGNIKLSGNRGVREISEIQVLDTVPEGLFDSFEAVEL